MKGCHVPACRVFHRDFLPPERAFAYAADLENFPMWFPGVVHVASADALPFTAAGKMYREMIAMPLGRERAVLIRVVDATPPRRLVTEGALPLLLPRMDMEFAACGSRGCRVTWRMHGRNARGWARWVVLPVVRRVMARRAALGMRRLKGRLERAA